MDTSNFPSPLYSPLGIEYQQAYDGPYEDLSYSVNGTTVIAGLKDGRVTGFGRPVLVIGRKLKQTAEKLYEVSGDIWYRACEIDDFAKFLLEKEYKAVPYFTQVIDLSKNEKELHADVRKSYKSLINKEDDLTFVEPLLPKFRDLHIKCSGKETRSLKTWEIQQKMILAEEAFSICRWENNSDETGRFDTAGLFIYNNHACYYGVGCSMEGAGSHALIWEAILHAKELGCKYFEMGEQVFSGDEKLVNISKFKRGFGGQTVMMLDLRKKEC